MDECYMDLRRLRPALRLRWMAPLRFKNEVCRKFGFTVNIGISTNKLLAKMASDFEKPNKVHTLFPEEVQVKMWPLPVRNCIWQGVPVWRR